MCHELEEWLGKVAGELRESSQRLLEVSSERLLKRGDGGRDWEAESGVRIRGESDYREAAAAAPRHNRRHAHR
ncbi:Uncharacterised protein [Mycobacteroides abscessus subsp. abscessus]|nr:Uncharacterised protein [Mycobacteroides abscessus subsp. abscessus]